MGDDPIATILEFLQRYNLSHTEATLRSELQGRQGAHECIIVGEQSEEIFSLAGFVRTETATGIGKEQLSIDTESNSSNRTHLLKPRLENFSFVDVKSSKEQSHNHLTVEVNGSLWQGRRRELVNFTLDQIAPNVEEVSKYAKHRDEDSKMVSTEKKNQSHTYAQENVHKTESLDLMFYDVAQNKDQTRLASVQAQSIEHHGQRRKMDETGQDQLKGISLYESRNGTGPSNPEVTQFDKAMIISETENYSGVISSLNRDKIITSRALPDSEYGNIFNDPCGGLSESGWFNGGRVEGVEGILVTNSIRGCPPFIVSSAANFSSTQELNLTKKAAYRRMEDATLMHLKKEPGNETPLSWETNFYNDNIGFVGRENIKGYKVQSNNDFSTLPQLRLGSLDMGEDPYSDGVRLDCLVDIGPSTNMASTLPSSFELGCYLDVSMGQDIAGNKWLSVNGATGSEGIVEESPELLSGFATLGDDGLDDPNVGFSLQHWGSDTYDDDDDPGYIRQPIEDEAWFLANEIDYLSDEDGAKSNKESDAHLQKDTEKLEGDLSALEEPDCSSGEQVCSFFLNDPQDVPTTDKESKSLSSKGVSIRKDFVSPSLIDTDSYGGQLMDTKKLKLRKGESVQQSFIVQNSLTLGDNVQILLSQVADSYVIDYERQGSERSSEAEQGREARYSASGDSSEGNVESLRDEEPSDYDAVYSAQEKNDNVGCRGTPEETGGYYDKAWSHKIFNSNKQNSIAECGSQRQGGYGFQQNQNQVDEDNAGITYGGFSFPYPLSTCNLAGQKEQSEKSLRAMQPNLMGFYDMDIYSNAVSGPDDTFSTWKRKSSESSPMISPSQEEPCNEVSSSVCSTLSPPSSGGYAVLDTRNQRVALGGQNETEGAEATTAAAATADEDDEIVAIQEQIRQIKAEEEFEIFNLRIIHRKDRTGFEEEKNFPVILNSIVAGRYHVTEYLGSAAFSKAIQVHDLRTGMDVCMKIIKNNKDFFDQSLDEIKILKYVNRHDPADKYHLLRLYDYFYYHEHLFIVCELLRANLYEFQKFNRESGGEIYFTMSRLQSITRQCLEAVEFLHHLGLIHCDLKPENILIKSYSRCEIKVIDLGSSCFQTDLLCPYVQSRSYRAPEVILGLPYNHKIDIWSLGCILAELCSGHVLFQNDSLATLLARVIGIIGPIDPEMLAKGRYTHKYFTKSHMLYERNPETNQLEYLLPKKTSLRHRLPSGDQGFVDFVAYLLQVNPENRPTSTEALKHPWLSYPYEPILS